MTSDEAEAAAWLDQRFWQNIFSVESKFLWWPQINALTGRRMWLCQAVCVLSGTLEEISPGVGEYELISTRWYREEDYILERLSR